MDESVEKIDGLVDPEAYQKYLKEREELVNDPERKITTSIGVVVDLFTSVGWINQKLGGEIPDDELEDLVERCKKFKSRLAKNSILKQKAFGGRNLHRSLVDLEGKKQEIIELFGRFFTGTEVHKIVLDWGIDIHYNNLEEFRKKHFATIKEKQEEYKQTYESIRLGYKRSRLEEYSTGILKLKDRLEKAWHRDDYALWLKTLEQIRKEVEGDRITIDGDLNIRIEETLNFHIYQELLQGLNINQIIISRVANRLRVNPVSLMMKLETSTYSKFTGFAKSSDPNAPIEYPSHLIYNFDDIRGKQDQLDNNEIQEAQIVEPEINEEASSVKDKLLNAIRQKAYTLNNSIQQVTELASKRDKDSKGKLAKYGKGFKSDRLSMQKLKEKEKNKKKKK